MERLNVICVDDQREVLSAVAQDLEPFCDWLVIEECESAKEAQELMDELDQAGDLVAVLVSDHVMPNQTGIELLTEVAHDPRFKHTKKVLLTGQATHSDTITAINLAGIDHYFEKPWDANQLRKAVQSLASEYIFSQGLDYTIYQQYLDQDVVLKHLREV